MVDFFSNTLNSTIPANLSNNKLVVLRLAEFQALIDTLGTVSNDILKFKRSKFCPFFFYSSQCDSWILSIVIIVSTGSTCNWLVLDIVKFVLSFELNSASLVVSWIEWLLRWSISHVQVRCSGWWSSSHRLSFWALWISWHSRHILLRTSWNWIVSLSVSTLFIIVIETGSSI